MIDQPPRNDALPRTFSLRTMFFVTTCVAVASAGYSLGVRLETSGPGAAIACLGLFVAACFAVKGRVRLAAGVFFLSMFFFSSTMPYPHSRESKRGVACRNNLKRIGLALWAYEQRYGSFPPAYIADANGKPLHSWRTLILPFMDQAAVFGTIDVDKAWDDPANSKHLRQGAQMYSCPSEGNNTTQTSYLAVVGPNTAWPGATGRKLSEFKDPSSTILVVEVVNSGIQWAEPRDLYVGQMAPGINAGGANLGMSSWHGPFANAVFADGSVRELPNELDPKTLAALFDIHNPPGISAVEAY